MDIHKSTSTTTHMTVTLTTDDIRDMIKNRFNLGSHISLSVDYSNSINGQIKINWTECSSTN